MLTTDRLTTAGVLAVISVAIRLSLVTSAALVSWDQSPGLRMNMVVLAPGGFVIVAYLLLTFRAFLRASHGFHGVDGLIPLLVVLKGVCLAIALLNQGVPAVCHALLVPIGITTIVIGVRLFSLGDRLYGWRHVYASLTVVAGVCFAAVVLVSSAVLIGAVLDLILATVFLRVAAESGLDAEEHGL